MGIEVEDGRQSSMTGITTGLPGSDRPGLRDWKGLAKPVRFQFLQLTPFPFPTACPQTDVQHLPSPLFAPSLQVRHYGHGNTTCSRKMSPSDMPLALPALLIASELAGIPA